MFFLYEDSFSTTSKYRREEASDASLVGDVQAELKIAREVGLSSDSPEVRAAKRGIRTGKQWRVEGVESLCTELNVHSITYKNAFE